MSIVDFIIDDKKWDEFLEYKNTKYVPIKEYNLIKKFIASREYRNIACLIHNHKYKFSIPRKKYINKNKSQKKRIIYQYSYEENIILKMVQYLTYEYDYIFSDNCYSFRKKRTSKDAFHIIKRNCKNMYGYKLDIKNYFNSIPTQKLLNKLKERINHNDYIFFKNILSDNKVNYNGNIQTENKGAIAGCPISCFLSNLYLNDLDYHFKEDVYIRYADDIIIFNKDKNELEKQILYIKYFLKEHDLLINEEKILYINKSEPFSFLGFYYNNGIISIAPHTVKKIKKKMKRKAKALRRWAKRKKLDYDKGAKSLINIFQYKFFYKEKNKELNWSLWYFPTINTANELKIIDEYFQNCIRYVITGKWNKSNKWVVPYSKLKDLGYISLVNEYYKYKKHV